ncbi:alcohol dehydrogenase catalytic domain-containing protein [[Actinomadura] parvosata]|uniref:alcohol dehydrogenase catalytic domain-containing protein n=1 Tax=[Actinomadura] parvosata TaxID=1955412 RepID=UPI00406D0C27
MLAAVFRDIGDVQVQQVPDPRIEAPTDAIVRIRAAGICGSDLWQYRGIDPLSPGARLGHEFVGVVEEVGGGVSLFEPGADVVAPFSYADGSCPMCRHGLPTSCAAGGVWGGAADPGGAQAEAIRVPFADANLVRLPEDAGAPGGPVRYLPTADVLPTAYHAVTSGDVTPTSIVAVIGDGPVALATVLAARRYGSEQIMMFGHHPQRLALAERLGATSVALSPGTPQDAAQLLQDELGVLATTTIDAVGTQMSVDIALACLRDGGTFSYVGLPVTGAGIKLLDTFDRNIAIRGGVSPARVYIPAILQEIIAGRMDPSPLIDSLLPLSVVQEGYVSMDQRRSLKAAVQP